PSVVTTDEPHGLQPGDTVVFNSLANAANVSNGQTYYVRSVTATSFTFARGPGLLPVTDASAGAGAAYWPKQRAAPVQQLTNASGHVSLNPGAVGYYQVTVTPKSSGFVADPDADQGVSTTGELTSYVFLHTLGFTFNVNFKFDRAGLIAGRVFQDLGG